MTLLDLFFTHPSKFYFDLSQVPSEELEKELAKRSKTKDIDKELLELREKHEKLLKQKYEMLRGG